MITGRAGRVFFILLHPADLTIIHTDISVELFGVNHSCTSGKDSFNHFIENLACASTIAMVYPTIFMLSRLLSLKVWN